MSAIAGLWCTDGRPAATPLDRMLAALSPYGPDGAGDWAEHDVALGHRVMHLHPEDLADRQPLTGAGGRFVLVADARLDNREDLAAALGLRLLDGVFTDADLILRAFERWGEACLPRLYGDYAFAVWDRERRQWLLARDGLGGRPLCYFRSPRLFAFSSMPSGLLALPEVPCEPDEELLARALDLISPDPHATCFRGIARVGMGELVVVTREGEVRRRHWDPQPEQLRLRRPRDYQEALRAEIDRAVRVRLPSSGGVASHLSSGLDSSAVATTAARLLAPRGDHVVAFTAVPRDGTDSDAPPGRLADEGRLAAITAAFHPNIEHIRVRTDGRSPLDALGWAFDLYQQPILNLCNQVWRDTIFEMAGDRGLRVLLTGQAGNFTISYKSRRPRGLAGLFDEVKALAWAGGAGPEPLVRAIATRLSPPKGAPVPGLINPDLRVELGAPDPARPPWPGSDTRSQRVAGLQQVELGDYVKGTLARWRIDERDPTADRRLVEFCLALPEAQFRLGGMPASIARRALADRVPPAVLRERARGLQATDWHAGFSDPVKELGEQVDRLAACPQAARLLDIARMREAIEHWPAAGWNGPGISELYRYHLLRALSNGDFLRRATALGESRRRGN